MIDTYLPDMECDPSSTCELIPLNIADLDLLLTPPDSPMSSHNSSDCCNMPTGEQEELANIMNELVDWQSDIVDELMPFDDLFDSPIGLPVDSRTPPSNSSAGPKCCTDPQSYLLQDCMWSSKHLDDLPSGSADLNTSSNLNEPLFTQLSISPPKNSLLDFIRKCPPKTSHMDKQSCNEKRTEESTASNSATICKIEPVKTQINVPASFINDHSYGLSYCYIEQDQRTVKNAPVRKEESLLRRRGSVSSVNDSDSSSSNSSNHTSARCVSSRPRKSLRDIAPTLFSRRAPIQQASRHISQNAVHKLVAKGAGVSIMHHNKQQDRLASKRNACVTLLANATKEKFFKSLKNERIAINRFKKAKLADDPFVKISCPLIDTECSEVKIKEEVITDDIEHHSPSLQRRNKYTELPLERRREHNDSERKRRDYLRTSFHELRDLVPKLSATGPKKVPRIQILYEAKTFTDELVAKQQELENAKKAELAKMQRLRAQLKNLERK